MYVCWNMTGQTLLYNNIPKYNVYNIDDSKDCWMVGWPCFTGFTLYITAVILIIIDLPLSSFGLWSLVFGHLHLHLPSYRFVFLSRASFLLLLLASPWWLLVPVPGTLLDWD